MGDLSIVFHVLSLLVLIGLVMWGLRLQMIVKTWRDWVSPESLQRCSVAEPVRILRVFACAIGAGFDSEIPVNSLPPVKIKLLSLFELHRQRGIAEITVSKGQPPVVCFILRQETGTMSTDLSQISHELGGSLRVELAQDPG
jgi:hypothetical protein